MKLRAFLLLLLAALVSGCQTASTFPAPGADWQTHSGQMQYVSAEGKSIIGEVVVRRSKQGDFQLAFSSGPGFPLMRLWKSGDRLRAEGALARGSWQGAAGKAPKPLQGWVSLPARFEAAVKGAAPAHFTISAPETRERFAFHFGS